MASGDEKTEGIELVHSRYQLQVPTLFVGLVVVVVVVVRVVEVEVEVEEEEEEVVVVVGVVVVLLRGRGGVVVANIWQNMIDW